MAQSGLSLVKVIGAGSFTPGDPIDNARLERILDAPVVTTMRYFGVASRHFAVAAENGEPLEPGLGCMEMAARAGEAALRDAGVDAAHIDLLITATSTPDHELPPFPYELQRRLGIPQCLTLDVRGGCVASLQGMKTAQAMLQAGHCRAALICSADFISDKFYAPMLRSSHLRTSDIMNALTFGDGAGALVLKRSEEADPGGLALDIGYLNVVSRFTDLKTGFHLKKGIPKHDNRAMKLAVPRLVNDMRGELLGHAGSVDHVDLLIVPQANSSLIDLNAAHPLDEKKFYIGNETGNAPSAAIFRALDIARKRGRLIPGQTRVGIMGLESASWIYAVGYLSGRSA